MYIKVTSVFKVFILSAVLPCDSDPCENGGTCLNGESTFTCLCTPGFTGDTCLLPGGHSELLEICSVFVLRKV